MQKRTFAGLDVVVENPRGTVRQWRDRDARLTGETVMKCDYGFIDGHVGADGDEVDCYLGDDESAPFVHVVHQLKTPDYEAFDEDKCFIGFKTEQEAKASYLSHRNDGEKAYGGMSVIPLEKFKAKLARRTGAGKIRHEVGQEGQVAMSTTVTFDAQRGADGKIRAGVWDYVCVEGYDEKDGRSTKFQPDTLAQMVDNLVERGDLIPVDWNHQSQYASQNGKPAPALAWYGALAVVWDGKIVKAGNAKGVEPVGTEGLDLSKNGLFAYRTEVTEHGQSLLGSFKYLSPTFTPNGSRRDGSECGYTLCAVAATNTPWQGGTQITFAKDDTTTMSAEPFDEYYSRIVKWARSNGQRTPPESAAREWYRNGNPVDIVIGHWADFLKTFSNAALEWKQPEYGRYYNSYTEASDAADAYRAQGKEARARSATVSGGPRRFIVEIKLDSQPGSTPVNQQQKEQRMAKLAKVAQLIGMEGDADDAAVKHALHAKMEEAAMGAASDEKFPYEEHAKKFEEAAQAYEDAHFEEEEGAEPPHLAMRKMAAKFRQLAKMGDPPFGGKETPSEEAAEEKAKMEKDDDKNEAKLAAMEAALKATQAQLAKFEAKEAAREAAEQAAKEATFERLADQAIAGGYPKEKRKALVSFARSDFEAARSTVEAFLPKTNAPAHLFERMTAVGAPVGQSAQARESFGPAKPRKVNAMGATFVEVDGNFADEIKRVAESKDPVIMAKLDKYIPESKRAIKFDRLMAAEKVVRAERPDLASEGEE